MKVLVGILVTAVLLLVPVLAADPPGFKHWTAAELSYDWQAMRGCPP